MVLASNAIMEGPKAARAFHPMGHAAHASGGGTISVAAARAKCGRVRGGGESLGAELAAKIAH